jgi:hypothetical protein
MSRNRNRQFNNRRNTGNTPHIPPVQSGKTSQKLEEGVNLTNIGYDPDTNLSSTSGGSLFYRRLTNNPSRDLNPLTQSRAIDIAYYLYDTNPLAKRVLELTRDYVIGDGIEVRSHSDDTDIQEVIDLFWNDSFNKLDLKLNEKVLELGLFGEQVYPVFVNPVNGAVRLGYLDPAVISQVNTYLKDVSSPLDIVIGNTQNQISVYLQKPERYKVVNVEDDPENEWYGRLVSVKLDSKGDGLEDYIDYVSPIKLPGDPAIDNVPTKDPGKYLGSCFLFQINKGSNSRRGRSDLLSLADWIDGYDQILFGEIDRNLLMRSFIWDVTLEGMTDKQIETYMLKNKAPAPGSVRAHNEKVVWNAVQPNLNSGDLTKDADLLLSYVATGSGHSKTWLNGTSDVNKSTSSELGEPAFKRLKARQKYVKYIIEHIITFVLDQAEIHGRIKKRENLPGSLNPGPWNFVVNVPEIRARDLATNSNALLSTMQALSLALESQIIDPFVAQEVVVMLLQQLGSNVDLKAMRERIEALPPPVLPQNVSQLPGTTPSKVPVQAKPLQDNLKSNTLNMPSNKNVSVNKDKGVGIK